MAINNFKFPGVELHQEFVETPVTGQSQLSVVVVGYQYKLNPYTATYNGAETTISLFDVPGYQDNETIDTSSGAPVGVIVTDGIFKNAECGASGGAINISGSTIATDRKSAQVVFDAPIQAGTASVTAFGTLPPQVGDTVDVYIGTGTAGTAAVVTAISGDTVQVEVSNSTVSLSAGTISKVAFWTVTEAELEGVTATDTDITIPANATAKIGGKNTAVPLMKEWEYNFLLKYRDSANSAVRKLKSVGSLAEIREAFGAIKADNPMAISLAFALLAAGGNVVYYTSVASDDADGYTDALDFIDKYQTVYSIVPATLDTDVIKACITFAERAYSDVESKTRYSVWYGLENNADPETIVGVRQTIGSSFTAQAVLGDDAIYNGQVVPNYALAAAAAGMRSYEPAYRPISNLGYNFFSLAETNGFTKSQLEYMGANGVWLIGNNYDGTPINLRQITTAVSNNINKDEESIVANADSIALTLCRVGENLVGCSNISPDLLVALHDTLTGIMERYLVNLTGNVYIGPQLLSYSIDRLEQDPVQLDHIYATITCEPPKPFNRFVLTLRIV